MSARARPGRARLGCRPAGDAPAWPQHTPATLGPPGCTVALLQSGGRPVRCPLRAFLHAGSLRRDPLSWRARPPLVQVTAQTAQTATFLCLFVVPLDLTSPGDRRPCPRVKVCPRPRTPGTRGAGRRRGTGGSRASFPAHRAGARLAGSPGDVRHIGEGRCGPHGRAEAQPREPRTRRGGGRAAAGGGAAGRGPPPRGPGNPAPPRAPRPRLAGPAPRPKLGRPRPPPRAVPGLGAGPGPSAPPRAGPVGPARAPPPVPEPGSRAALGLRARGRPSARRGAMVPPLSPPLCTLPPGPGPARFVCFCEGDGEDGGPGGFNL